MARSYFKTLVSTGALVSLLSTSLTLFPTPTSAQISGDTRQGFPGRRVGGGTRGNCAAAEQLIALVPETNLNVTASANPSLWFYVSGSDTMQTIEFVLYDQNDKLVYETIVPAPKQAEIMRIVLPNSAEHLPLATGETYHWYLSLVCPVTRAGDISVDGGLQRIEPSANLTQQLETATPAEQAALYQQAGLWGDAITILAGLRSTQPSDLTVVDEWTQLLQTEGLEHIAQESIEVSSSR